MQDLVYKKNPLLALCPKDESPSGMTGKYLPVPLVYGTPQGRSARFSSAQTNQTAPYLASFFVYRVANYGIATIDNELVEATKNDSASFVNESKLIIDTSIRNLSNDIALSMYGDGSGKRGAMSAISTGVITLTNSADVVNFEVGMTLLSYSNANAQSTSNALGYIIAVDRTAATGQITVSATAGGAAGTPTNWSASSFPNLAVDGDWASGSITLQTQYLKISGLQSWIPNSAPGGSDNFWGVNRSADVTRLAGIRYNGSSESIEEALISAASFAAREGGAPDYCFTNFTSYAALEKSLGAKVQYVSVKHDMAEIAFQGITVNAPYGPITVIPDRNCPPQRAFLLQLDTWKLRTIGKAPHILTYGLEGLEGLRVGTADALEIRMGMYGNLVCRAPGWNCTLTLST